MGHPAYAVITGLHAIIGETGMLAYLSYMAERLVECHRPLRDTGSLLLHCDPTASHYLKLVLDATFGPKDFRNEIVWKRTSSKKGGRKLGEVHDIILFYAKTDANRFHHVYTEHDQEYVRKFYRHEDKHGEFQVGDLTAAGTRHGLSGKPWREIDPGARGRHWGTPGAFPAHAPRPSEWDDWNSHQKLDHLDAAGLIYWPPTGGVPRFKRYLSTSPGAALTNVITDVPPLSAKANEKLGYPTQKPQKLLERLIETATNPGDLVLDPFCGCGTTAAAVRALGRNFAGVDISAFAIELVRTRRLKDDSVPVNGIPTDLEAARTLHRADPFAFERWAISRDPGPAR